MADIWLMRHAAYEGHHPGYHALPDAPLTEEGREQARHAADSLPAGITSVISSAMPRARQTAEILCRYAGLPLLASSNIFAEWRAPSIVLGHGPDAYPRTYSIWREHRLEQPDLRCEDGESLSDLHARAKECSALLSATAWHGDVLVVSHKILLGVVSRLDDGPTAFEAAARDPWDFVERRCIEPLYRGGAHGGATARASRHRAGRA